jgi:hypothetical protein
MVFRSSVPDFQLGNPLYAGARVTFFAADENGLKTGTPAPLYAEPTGPNQALNPQTLDSDGKLAAPVYIDRAVVAEVLFQNNTSHTTGAIVPHGQWQGFWQPEQLYVPGDLILEPQEGAIRRLYAATQLYRSGESIAADIAAGLLSLRFEQMAIIRILTPAEYDALDPPDGETLFVILAPGE